MVGDERIYWLTLECQKQFCPEYCPTDTWHYWSDKRQDGTGVGYKLDKRFRIVCSKREFFLNIYFRTLSLKNVMQRLLSNLIVHEFFSLYKQCDQDTTNSHSDETDRSRRNSRNQSNWLVLLLRIKHFLSIFLTTLKFVFITLSLCIIL